LRTESTTQPAREVAVSPQTPHANRAALLLWLTAMA